MSGARTRLAGALAVALLCAPQAGAVGTGNDLLPDPPAGPSVVRLAIVANVGSPVIDIANAADGSGRLFLVSPNGVIRVLRGGVVLATPFLNAPAYPPDRAMSSVAFHPDYATNGKLYVITGEQTPNALPKDFVPPQVDSATAYDNVLVEYLASAADPNQVNAATRRELLRMHQPDQDMDVNDLAFVRNGAGWNLLVAAGDGGHTRSGSPTHYETNAQLLTNPYGKFLRLDVDHVGPNGKYAIPADNPFAGGAGGNVPEIFAWGVRNPWRLGVDRLTGEAYSGINGDFTVEWIVRVERAKNYGWATREGGFLWDPVTGNASVDPSPDPAITLPLARWDHNGSTKAWGSVISGTVYRGARMPDLYGKLMLLDWVAGEMLAVDPASGALERVGIDPGGAPLLASTDITWGEDEVGELYLGGLDGRVRKVGPRVLCGDLTLDGDLTTADGARVRAHLTGGALTAAEQARCDVVAPAGDCDVVDAARIRRAALGLQPGVAPVCPAASP